MHEGKAHHDWQIASASMALLANINRDPKKGRALRPEDFNPWESRMRKVRKGNLPTAGVEALKAAIIDGKGEREVDVEFGGRK